MQAGIRSSKETGDLAGRRYGRQDGSTEESARDRTAVLVNIAVQTLYPSRCPLCGGIMPVRTQLPRKMHYTELVCRNCTGKLPWITEPFCKKCGKPLESMIREYCTDCGRRKHRFIAGRSIFLYEGEFRDSVLQMKFHDHREYIDFYAAAMAEAGRSFLRGEAIRMILPVPMNSRKRRERGFDQCRLLAERFSERAGIPVNRSSLIRTKYTRAQKGLDLYQRKENLREAFSVREAEKISEPVLLLDDIYTTGSTVDACCEALLKCGIREIYFLALCTGRSDL